MYQHIVYLKLNIIFQLNLNFLKSDSYPTYVLPL